MLRAKKKILILLAFLVMIMGALVIIGWLFDISFLKSFLPGQVTMKFNVALGFALSGSAFYLIVKKRWLVVSGLLSILILSLGAASIFEDIFDIELGIDQLFVKEIDDQTLRVHSPGRPAPATSFCFILIGIAFLALISGRNRAINIAQYFLHCVTLISFVALLGYIFIISPLYKLFFFYSMAFHTALSLFLLSLGASLIHSDTGMTALFSGKKIGNIMIRVLFPEMLLIQVLLGFLVLLSSRHSWITSEFGIAIYSVGSVLVTLFLLRNNSMRLNRLDDEKTDARTRVINLNRNLKKTVKDLSDYQQALDASSIIAITDQNGLILDANENFTRISKYSREELIGRTHRIINSGYHSKDFFRDLWATISAGKIWKGEIKNKAKDGTYYWVDTTIVPFIGDNGKPNKYLAIRSDITERKKAEEQLRINEQRIRFVVENTPAGVAMFDRQMRYIMVSKRWREDYKLGDRNIIGLCHYDIFPEIPERWKEFHRRSMAGEKLSSDAEPFVRADGSIEWVKWELFPWYTESGEIGGVILFSESVTKRKLAEDKLIASEEKYRNLYENSLVSIVTTDMKTLKPVTVNDVAVELFGYRSQKEFLAHFDGKKHFVNPIEREDNIEAVKEKGELQSKVQEMKKLDGTHFWGKIFVKLNSANNIAETVIVDITNQVHARENLAAKIKELENANKELESFNFISSHDLQEPLRKIRNFASVLLKNEEKNLSSEGKQYLERMSETAQKMRSLIENLLIYARTKNVARQFEKTDISKILEEALAEFNKVIKEKNVLVSTNVHCEAQVIPFQLRQLLANLISNSVKFSDPERQLQISVTSETLPGSKLSPKLSPKIKYCHIAFTDNGIGFEPQYNDRIFEIFERLHGNEKYSGTGIGLAICKRIAENHNGLITASGELNKGVRFDIYLPSS